MDSYLCKRCGTSREPGTDRSPCNCGETALVANMACSLSGSGKLTASAGLRKEVVRTWRERWAQIQIDLATISESKSSVMSTETMEAAHQELLKFYTVCYHLKDALKKELPGKSKLVEDAITNDPTLCLLADLANLEKHAGLDTKKQSPRSGAIPRVKEYIGDPVHGAEWQLRLNIEHKGATLDGLQIAKDSVAAWQGILRSWNLI